MLYECYSFLFLFLGRKVYKYKSTSRMYLYLSTFHGTTINNLLLLGTITIFTIQGLTLCRWRFSPIKKPNLLTYLLHTTSSALHAAVCFSCISPCKKPPKENSKNIFWKLMTEKFLASSTYLPENSSLLHFYEKLRSLSMHVVNKMYIPEGWSLITSKDKWRQRQQTQVAYTVQEQ